MRVGLIDVDGKMPNLALMKLAAYHKARGDTVSWYSPLWSESDRVYASKVFTYTPDYAYAPTGTVRGGIGYQGETIQPDSEHPWEHVCPDYGLYPHVDYSFGFLTRGCIRHCPWCVVPDKEGSIRAHADIHEFLRHDRVVLMDNNVLACNHGIEQIEKLIQLRVKVDFNQGLDARLIDAAMARLLARVRWLSPLRLACDTPADHRPVAAAVKLLRDAGATPRHYFCYMLVNDVDEAHERAMFLCRLGVDPFAQPYRDRKGTEPTREQADFARWVNHKAIFKTVAWKDYKG